MQPYQNLERDAEAYVKSLHQILPTHPQNTDTYHSESLPSYNTINSSLPVLYPIPITMPVPSLENINPTRQVVGGLENVQGQSFNSMKNDLNKPSPSLLISTENRPASPLNQIKQMSQIKKICSFDAELYMQRNSRVETQGVIQTISDCEPQEEVVLMGMISKIDVEINNTELKISKLKSKQDQIIRATVKKDTDTNAEEDTPKSHKCQNLAKKIYAENRMKAHESYATMEKLGPKVVWPLYNQPSDTHVFYENRMKHAMFFSRLIKHLEKKYLERERRQNQSAALYSEMVQDWLKTVSKLENSQARRERDAKRKYYFEKIFPELRSPRETYKRFSKIACFKSQVNSNEVVDDLKKEEFKNMKLRSVVPPHLLNMEQRRIVYINNNGHIKDFEAYYKQKQMVNIWTQEEENIFIKKFIQHPKNFSIIASFLKQKSVQDCVQYYYLSKKTVNYRWLLGKSGHWKRKQSPQS